MKLTKEGNPNILSIPVQADMDDPVFVDANVFLRFFVKDVEAQYEKVRKVFKSPYPSGLSV